MKTGCLLHLLGSALLNDTLNLLSINVREDWLMDACEGTLGGLGDLGYKRLWIWVLVGVQLLR